MKNISQTVIVLSFYAIVGMCVWMTQNPWWTLLCLLTPTFNSQCDCEEEEEKQ